MLRDSAKLLRREVAMHLCRPRVDGVKAAGAGSFTLRTHDSVKHGES